MKRSIILLLLVTAKNVTDQVAVNSDGSLPDN
jgi:hypothetical protein